MWAGELSISYFDRIVADSSNVRPTCVSLLATDFDSLSALISDLLSHLHHLLFNCRCEL